MLDALDIFDALSAFSLLFKANFVLSIHTLMSGRACLGSWQGPQAPTGPTSTVFPALGLPGGWQQWQAAILISQNDPDVTLLQGTVGK